MPAGADIRLIPTSSCRARVASGRYLRRHAGRGWRLADTYDVMPA